MGNSTQWSEKNPKMPGIPSSSPLPWTHRWSQKNDTAVKGIGASPNSEGLSATASLGLHRREAYCVLVGVACNVDSVSALDAKVPDYVWTEVIARDICTYQVGAQLVTFTIELLSDTEFLLF